MCIRDRYFTVNGVQIPTTKLALTGNAGVDAAAFATQANKDLSSAAGLVMTATDGYDSSNTVSLIDYANNATTSVGERYTTAQLTAASTDSADLLFETGREDEFTLTVTDAAGNTNTVSASLAHFNVAGTAVADIEEAIVAAWAAKYGETGTASAAAIATIADSGSGKFIVDMLQTDSGGFGASISFSVSDKTTTTGSTFTTGNIGYVIGTTAATTDNTTIGTTTAGDGLIVTFESKLDGVTDSILTGMTSGVTGGGDPVATMTELTTTYSTATGLISYETASLNRTDMRNVEAAVASTATGTAQTLFNRVAWLG